MPGKINQWGSLVFVGCVSSNHVFSILLLLPHHQEVSDLLVNPELVDNLWRLGTGKEEGCRTGPLGYI